MIFSIIIPAYNEEEAIEATIKRCISAREKIITDTKIQDVEIIVVNDGSQDKTKEITQNFSNANQNVKAIHHSKNAGYGAAILTGMEAAKGEIVSFMDADGTCDPVDFVGMIQCIQHENCDMVVGSRLNKTSEMPRIRKIGNVLYASLINLLGTTIISDAASGMRVLKENTLKKLLPLPSGLHFTPAMSAKAVLDETILIKEYPITYKERLGRSKLNVIKDGLRFFNVIITTFLAYRPFKFFGGLGIVTILILALYAYAENSLGFVHLPHKQYLFLAMLNLIFIGHLLNDIVLVLTPIKKLRYSFIYSLFSFLFSRISLVTISMASLLAFLFLWPHDTTIVYLAINFFVFAVIRHTLNTIVRGLQNRVRIF